MLVHSLKSLLTRFRDDTRGTVMVEAVICLPLLVWALAATFEFFEVHRYKSAREKATYTVADMLSREVVEIGPTYMDNTKKLFDGISNDDGINQIRVSVVKFDEDTDSFSISWSEVRGVGDLTKLTNSDVASAHNTLPLMGDGEELILVESKSTYSPLFKVGLASNLAIETRIFTEIRFVGQLKWANS